MRLVEMALEVCKKSNKLNHLIEEDLKDSYCPTYFFKIIKPLKPRKDDRDICLFNDSSEDYTDKCNGCWDREFNAQ